MVKEALKALDSRKGVSSQAIHNYIKQKYPSVDVVRLKHFVRRALKKGIETGTLVRPANSNVTTGAAGRFRVRWGGVEFTNLKYNNVVKSISLFCCGTLSVSLHRKSRRRNQKLRTRILMCRRSPKQRGAPRSLKKQVRPKWHIHYTRFL